MNISNKTSLSFSRVLIFIFMAALLAADALGWKYLPDIVLSQSFMEHRAAYTAVAYLLSIPAWAALILLLKLINALSTGKVFTASNISLLRAISYCCFAVAVISLVCAFTIHPFMLVMMLAAALMGLIVRIVKNVFAQAAEMKDELDLTI